MGEFLRQSALPLLACLGLLTSSAVLLSGKDHRQTVADENAQQTITQQGDPTDFSAEELRMLQVRFGVHGPQTPLAQLLTRGVDQLQPLRTQTLDKIKALKEGIKICDV